jgi:branched-chain amino acid transport system ATP-binding protein
MSRLPISEHPTSTGRSGPLLALEAIESGYGQIKVLHGIDLKVYKGEVVALIGANGVGKTTLLRTISGVARLTGGHVLWDGDDISGRTPETVCRLGISHCPEGRRVFRTLTVEENIAAALLPRSPQRRAVLDHSYALFPILAEKRHESAITLSGGQQQMLAIARALASAPRLLMVDELSLGLAPKAVHAIAEALLGLAQEGLTILLVEQNVELALDISDYAMVIEGGRCVVEGPSDALQAEPRLRQLYMAHADA